MEFLETEPYADARHIWPTSGQHIIAQYTDEYVVVYQAFKPEIGRYAAEHGRFLGAPGYLEGRMSWIKTNWLWMQYRSGWGTKRDQETTLAIFLRRGYFEELLGSAVGAKNYSHDRDESAHRQARRAEATHHRVRLQWDPDHLPNGAKHHGRRAIQLGLKGEFLRRLASGEEVVRIVDASAFAEEQRVAGCVTVPRERLYAVADAAARARIGLADAPPRPLLALLLAAGEEGEQGDDDARRLADERRRCEGACTFELADSGAAYDGFVGVGTEGAAAALRLAAERGARFVVLQPMSPLAGDAGFAGPALLCGPHGVALLAGERFPEGVAAPQRLGSWPLRSFLLPLVPPGVAAEPPPPPSSEEPPSADDKRAAKKAAKRARAAAKEAAAAAAANAKPRVLMLHGYQQSADIFGKRLNQLRRKLRAKAELVFAQAPHALEQDQDDEPEQFTWWWYEQDDRRDFASAFRAAEYQYIGVEESLAGLREAWAAQGPFDGIFGFSQGAEMAAILAADLARAGSPPRFVVLASGFKRPEPANLDWYPPAEPLAIPSLHVFAEDDPIVPRERSEELVTVFRDAQVHVHDGEHYVPQRKEHIPVLVSFISTFGGGSLGASGGGDAGATA